MVNKIIDKYMVDHSGDFGGGAYSIHRDFSNCINTTPSSNCGHMVVEVYETINKNMHPLSRQKS